MKNKRLVQRAYDSFNILADDSYKSRMANLTKVGEYGFAILILWNRMEITLKLLRYYNDMPEFPDQLNFITRKWTILNNVFNCNTENFKLILDRGNSTSLWKIRDKIAHASCELDSVDFEKYKIAANQVLALLSQNLLPLNDYKAKRNKQKK